MPTAATSATADQRARLAAGDLAPDADVTTADGHPLRLRDLWQEQPLVLTFLRHFG